MILSASVRCADPSTMTPWARLAQDVPICSGCSYLLLYPEDHLVLCGSGHGHLGALMLRHRAEQKAAVGDELGAGREAGLVGGDE